jgi:hypothetical protein
MTLKYRCHICHLKFDNRKNKSEHLKKHKRERTYVPARVKLIKMFLDHQNEILN